MAERKNKGQKGKGKQGNQGKGKGNKGKGKDKRNKHARIAEKIEKRKDLLDEDEKEQIKEIARSINRKRQTKTEVEEEYERNGDDKRLTDRWEKNPDLGYAVHHHREYRHPMSHPAFGALESTSEEVVEL